MKTPSPLATSLAALPFGAPDGRGGRYRFLSLEQWRIVLEAKHAGDLWLDLYMVASSLARRRRKKFYRSSKSMRQAAHHVRVLLARSWDA